MARKWTEEHVRRLFWRAGFGATAREARRFAGAGREATLRFVLDGGGGPELAGPRPHAEGRPLDPVGRWGHAGIWWLDRMVRSRRPLVEKMTLFWHDHFATVGEPRLMLDQNRMLRRLCLGGFEPLVSAVTVDPAMQFFQSLAGSHRSAPNENYARELLELFTLGGGYDERDVREVARALTGFGGRWDERSVFRGIVFYPDSHDDGVKRILGQSGRFGCADVMRILCAHPNHAPLIVDKLWSYFVTEPLDGPTRRSLVRTYRRSGLQVKPLVAAILRHPALYARLDSPDMVKCPAVFVAGALRSVGAGITTDAWSWLMADMGQMLFQPPSVAGWEWGTAWLSTATVHARFQAAAWLMREEGPLWVDDASTSTRQTAQEVVAAARRRAGGPWTSRATDAALERFARRVDPAGADGPQRQQFADMRMRLLHELLLAGPDAQLH